MRTRGACIPNANQLMPRIEAVYLEAAGRRRMPLRASMLLAWLLFTAVSWLGVTSGAEVPGCKGRKIAIVDLDMFADMTKGRPPCYPNTLKVDPASGDLFLQQKQLIEVTPHFASPLAATWFISEAIRNSDHFTQYIEYADLVFVDDYCYWSWWLAYINSMGKPAMNQGSPGDFIVSAYEALFKTPRWQATHGKDFVFVDPHPGFAAGKAVQSLWGSHCGTMQNATQLIAEMPMRRRCQSFSTLKDHLVVMPIPAAIADTNDTATYSTNPGEFWTAALAQRQNAGNLTLPVKRTEFLHFLGRCSPHSKNNVGKRMRNYFVQQVFKSAPANVSVKCSEVDHRNHTDQHSPSFSELRKAVFCLILPGDHQATRLLSEAFAAGCIPVFVGPPWHSMPFADIVDYNSTAIFLNISDYTGWMDQPLEDASTLTAHVSAHPKEARFWVPDIPNLQSFAVQLPKPAHILPYLQSLSVEETSRRAKAVWAAREKFLFHPRGKEIPGGIQAALTSVCKRVPARPMIDWSKADKA